MAFAREVLRVRPWRRQAEVLELVARHPWVAARSGHKVGKSTSAAVLALWWVLTRPRGRVVLTAPADHQVKNILWPELRRLYRQAATPLGGKLYDDHRSGLKYDDGREVLGLTTNEAERIAGLSSPNLFFVVDEAAGYPEELFEAVFGNLAGGGKVLLLGNPTRTSGTFYEAFHQKRDLWATAHISSLESPCITNAEPCVPGLATPEWAVRAKAQWGGEESPIYQVRVLGEFPRQAENAVIGLEVVEAATRRWAETPDGGTLELGVDVARYGDDRSVIFPRRGKKAFKPVVLRSMDVVEVAGKALEAARALAKPGEKPVVKVDEIGIGAGVADILKRSGEVLVVAVNVAEHARAEGYAKLRDQLWFSLRDWLAEGGAIPPEPELEAELVAPTYTFDAQGRAKVEAKDQIKRRLGRSPDLADALALAVWSAKPAPAFSSKRPSLKRRF